MTKPTLEHLPAEVRAAVEFLRDNPTEPFQLASAYRKHTEAEMVIAKHKRFRDDDRYAISTGRGMYATQKARVWAEQFFPKPPPAVEVDTWEPESY